jgi:cytochrome P450
MPSMQHTLEGQSGRARPPGPSDGFFGLRLAGRMAADYIAFLQQQHQRYGDAVYMRLGTFRDFCFSHPDLIREVLVEKAKSFVRWERGMQVFALAHGQSVLTAEGAVWQRQRRMLQPGFGPKRFDGYARQMAAAGAAVLDALPADDAVPADFEHAMTMLTMDVIMRTMFSREAPQEAAAASEAVRVLSHAAMKEMFLPFAVPQWVPLPWRAEMRRMLRMLDELVWRLVRERRAQPGEHDDLLGMLMSAADEEGDQGRLSDQEIRDQCMTTFLAGHETTATALAWWGWAMAAHPEIAQRATREVDAALEGRDPGHADLPRLAYLGQTLKETLRLRPPAAALFTRRAVEDVQIGAWHLRKGAMVLITPYVVHHDPRWYPEPERFDPDRFSPERAERIPRGAYIPFGVGPRVCIGNNFAMMEMTLLAAMLLQRFELGLPAGAPVPHPHLNVTLRPADGLRLLLRKRTQSSTATWQSTGSARPDHPGSACPRPGAAAAS